MDNHDRRLAEERKVRLVHRRCSLLICATLSAQSVVGTAAWAGEITSTQPGPQSVATETGPEAPTTEEDAEQPEPQIESVHSRATTARHEPEPPGYVRTLNQLGEELRLPGLDELSWLQFGIEQRTRFEHRDDFYRANLETDDRFLMRTRTYLGVRDILDPFRFGIEFQDSRRFGSQLPQNTRDIDEADILQAFGELYFDDALGKGQPFRFQVGRMSIDAVDRRLVTRNKFRNTTNSFGGFRLRLGQARSPWALDVFAVQPVERCLVSSDRADEERWFYGVTGCWRQWSPFLALEPFYFLLDKDRKGYDQPDREIHTLGLHGFGLIAETGFDYDFNAAFQLGQDGDRDHRAFASHAQVGYTFSHPWRPRMAVWVNYASGDRDPDDGVSERFDRLFGDAHTMYGFSDLFSWQNMINPAIYISARPTKKLCLEAFYRVYWLASDSDAFVCARRRDPDGDSGDFVGQEIDLRSRYQLTRHLELEGGYAHFFPGPFVANTGSPTDDSDFFYVQITLRF